MIRRRISVLALAFAVAGSLALRAVPTVTAVGSGDLTPPTFDAFEWTGPNTPVHDVLLVWNDFLNETQLPDIGDFDVELEEVSLDIASVEFTHAGFVDPENAATIMTLFLTDPVTVPGNLTVSYTPGAYPNLNPVTDLAGNDAEAAVDVAVQVLAFSEFGAAMILVDGNYGPDHIGLLFSDAVDPLTVPPESAFKVTRNGIGTPMIPTSVTIFPAFSGRILDLALPAGFRSGDIATMTYEPPLSGGIENMVGTAAPEFQDGEVFLFLVAQDSVGGTTGAGGGSFSTDAGDPGTTAQDPIATSVSVPGAASIVIDEGAVDLPPSTTEYTFIGETVEIEVTPAATPEDPIVIDFAIDASVLAAAGATEATVQLLRDGVLIGPCTGAPGTALPDDPCIASRVAFPAPPDPLEYALLRVYTSHASEWTFAVRNPYSWAGFRQPVDNPPVVNLGTAGKAIPVKFTLGGDRGLDIFQPRYPASEPVDCESGLPTDAIEVTTTAGSSSLTYDATTSLYTYVWRSDRAWSSAPGGPCRRLVLRFVDGSTHEAAFRFR